MSINEISVEEETKIEDISNGLYRRITEETERFLKSQMEILGGDIADVTKVVYPEDSLALATYNYCCKPILGVRLGEGRMSIEFDVPKLTQETPNKGEVQDEAV